MIPSTLTNANDWVAGQTGFGADTAAGVGQVYGSSTVPRVYHVETRLPHGKPALLLDIGSVGNLVTNGSDCKLQPPYEQACALSSDERNVP